LALESDNQGLGSRIQFLLTVHAGEAKVTDDEVALPIYQDVVGLEVTMQHVCAVDVLEAAEQLVHERLKKGAGRGGGYVSLG
jgi:hypothetical protein